jgi:hypothetical protein
VARCGPRAQKATPSTASTQAPRHPGTQAPASSTAPKAGGSLTVLEGAGFAGDWPDGLDPATNINGAADQSYMDAIYGELFELGPKGAIVNDLATGYSFSSDATTITINLRQGVKFTDGTPFNASAVVWNIQRDLKSACTCKPTWPVKSVTATGPGRTRYRRRLVRAGARLFGIPFPPLGERFDRLGEQLDVITGLWRTAPGDRFSYHGQHYQLEECASIPRPAPPGPCPGHPGRHPARQGPGCRAANAAPAATTASRPTARPRAAVALACSTSSAPQAPPANIVATARTRRASPARP